MIMSSNRVRMYCCASMKKTCESHVMHSLLLTHIFVKNCTNTLPALYYDANNNIKIQQTKKKYDIQEKHNF